MSVTQFRDKYRASFRSGRQLKSLYFETEKQARYFLDKLDTLKATSWEESAVKRSDAKNQDLPAGFCDTFHNKIVDGKAHSTKILTCTFKHENKLLTRSVSYGNKLTRQDAIIRLTERVLEILKDEK